MPRLGKLSGLAAMHGFRRTKVINEIAGVCQIQKCEGNVNMTTKTKIALCLMGLVGVWVFFDSLADPAVLTMQLFFTAIIAVEGVGYFWMPD